MAMTADSKKAFRTERLLTDAGGIGPLARPADPFSAERHARHEPHDGHGVHLAQEIAVFLPKSLFFI
jgi:hypothetical protein